ncbi:MAG: glycosyltransferase family 87 protein, partial [Candidatus Dormibacteraceae bacterium]
MARLFTTGTAVALAVLSIVNIVLAAAATSWQIGTDFRLPYAAAQIGLREGWTHIYDPAIQRAAVLALGHSNLYQPYLNLPPWAFVVAPLTLIPYPVAYAIWVSLMVACLVAAAWLAAPPERVVRVIYLGAAFGNLEVALGPGFGQPAALVALAVVGCWRLLKADRPVLAGLVLAVISVKPHIALLVPFALLLAGHTRAFLYWAGATAVLAAVSFVALQPSGTQAYLSLLATGPSYLAGLPAWTPAALMGTAVGVPLEGLLLAGAAAAAWLHRRQGPEVPIAVGIVATLAIVPYLHAQDFVVLVVAIWMLHRARLAHLGGRALAVFWVAAAIGIEW